MPAARHTEFERDPIATLKAREFIRMWNKADRAGIHKKIAEHFGISIATVYRIRKKLGLMPLHSKKHPGRSNLIKRIRKMYWQDKSTLWIGKVLRMTHENVRRILKSQGIELNPQYVINPLYFSTKSGLSPTKLAKKIKEMYLDEKKTAAHIAKELNIDQGTVSTKLYAMGVKVLRQNHQLIKGGYPCNWCNTIMEKVWQNKGPGKQKYCNHKCKNRANDYRRMRRGQKISVTRLAAMESSLKQAWGNDYEKQRIKIMDVNPAIKNDQKLARINKIWLKRGEKSPRLVESHEAKT